MSVADTLVKADPRLIIPLDLPTVDEARAIVDALGDTVSFYKVGLELFATGGGMTLASELKAAGKQVFLDWKLHDIGTTVQRSAAVLADSGCDFLTVHGEPQVMEAAVRGKGRSGLKILAVTVLTSLSDADLIEMGFSETARSLVERRIHQAVAAGCDGVVASPHEAALARAIGGKDFLVVTPGVRPDWSAKNDQARAATPADALKAGASHLVVGRPITAANDPRDAAMRVAAEMAGV
ncbi:orotidine-5'-phosphate decarboxylase [Phenylobacterium sp. 20VBR1]|uniref:Orotidine 5'-phosphate decarboxylase n=1 Tax=Phenylobacterium glaciei TaxID=2803784 RepID=A0A941HTS0_9CAUL|nr:orotidine-5'-phosphate decarboxylase [Phenylobacterium glaciei]MBR7617854.1 orotidine-5'-phosphate decarboxylase [Phenylobacterium glaciei]